MTPQEIEEYEQWLESLYGPRAYSEAELRHLFETNDPEGDTNDDR